MSKQHSSVMRLSKTWKKLFWVLDTKKLSCYQGEHVRYYFIILCFKIFTLFYYSQEFH